MGGPVALFFQIASHVAYLPGILVLLYAGRVQAAMALLLVIPASVHYHTCLFTGGDVCLTSLRFAGAGDYFFAFLAGAVLYLQSNAIDHDSMSGALIVVVGLLFWMVPVMYESILVFAVVSSALLWLTVYPNLVLRRRPPYHNPGINWIVFILSVMSYAMLGLPFPTGSFWYDVTHPIWHVLSGTVIFFYAVYLTRLVVIWVRQAPLGFQLCYAVHVEDHIKF